MDLTELHSLCKSIRFIAAEDFKNKIENPIFELTDNVINIEIQDMKQTIGQKVRSKLYNKYTISDAQERVIKNTIDDYVEKAVVRGWNFANNIRLKGNNCNY